MLKFRIQTTDEYERLVKFFVENELEFDGDEEVDTDIIHCWKLTHTDDVLIGGCVLAMRQGKYIIDGIAVTKLFRKFGLGKIMLKKAINEVKKLGGNELYLVARAPEFFRNYGFETVDANDAPLFFECAQCPQYQKTCFPEIMRLRVL
jgi:N-acetylglutamate synthase-like GNAT family acetyltransferase